MACGTEAKQRGAGLREVGYPAREARGNVVSCISKRVVGDQSVIEQFYCKRLELMSLFPKSLAGVDGPGLGLRAQSLRGSCKGRTNASLAPAL